MREDKKMKKFWLLLLFLLGICSNNANAQSLAVKYTYMGGKIMYLGIPDYPPFSYYKENSYESVFLKPLYDFAKKRRIELSLFVNGHSIVNNLKQSIFLASTCQSQLFIGAYPETKTFNKLHLLYPAVVSNPLHIITLPETNEKIKSTADLQNLKGAAIKTEYFSDFVMRKIEPLKLYYAETPLDAYEKLFTGEIDYIIGGLYYNKIEASKYGIERYLSYSKKPIFKIPVFLATCNKLPRLNAFEKVLKEEMSKPEFAEAIKNSVLDVVNKELEKNQGVVPPSFAKQVIEGPTPEELEAAQKAEALKQKQQQEKEKREKMLEEEQKLDNILKRI